MSNLSSFFCYSDSVDHGLRTPDEDFFSSKSQTFGLGQTNWPDTFWVIWGIFGRYISTHFGTVSPLSMFSIKNRVLG